MKLRTACFMILALMVSLLVTCVYSVSYGNTVTIQSRGTIAYPEPPKPAPSETPVSWYQVFKEIMSYVVGFSTVIGAIFSVLRYRREHITKIVNRFGFN